MAMQSGGKAGPREDEALKHEVHGEVQANRATRIEEWREPEPPGEDQPDATQVLADRSPGGAFPDPAQIELRSDLARHLDRHAFPGDREHLAAILADHQATDALHDLVLQLPAGATFRNLHEVLEALGLPIESREDAEGEPSPPS
jgi:hypothetical protein